MYLKRNMRLVFLYWLEELGDYWLYKYSKISDENKRAYRQTIPGLIDMIKGSCEIKFNTRNS